MVSSLRGAQRSDRLDSVSKINASISSMSIEDASSREKEIAELKSQLLELSKEKRDLESKLVSQTSVQRSLPSENVPKTPPPRIPLPGLQKSTQALDSLAESLLAESMRNSIQPSSTISPTNTSKTTIFSDYSARLTASQPETVKNWIETTVTVDISQIRDLQATYSETIWKLGELFMGIEYEVANSIKLALALKAYQSGMNKYPPSDAARRRLSEHANDFDSLLLVLIQIISVMMWEKEKLRIPLSIPTENQAQLIITFLADQFRSNKKPVLPSDVASAEVTRLEGENRKLSAENQETANKYRDLDKKYQEALDSIEYLKNQKRSLSSQLKVQAATIEKQAESESKIKQLESQLSKNNQAFQSKLETLSTENVELTRRITEVQRENDNYKRKESELENSRSFSNLATKEESSDVEELNKVKVELEKSTRKLLYCFDSKICSRPINCELISENLFQRLRRSVKRASRQFRIRQRRLRKADCWT
ncbi:hypothetical protein BKA69DRAFT_805380 [Paraphysoderma sedebokerense]|nr:hypothetical protein BKA69DRAFT_805380 [Paraphysoderma sedebokerense]